MIERTADGSVLRATMRRVPSPVVIVTAVGPAGPRGITIGSFTSVSLDPPLVSFNVGNGSQMHEPIASCDRFGVHLIGPQHLDLAARFAMPLLSGDQQFEEIPYHMENACVPLLEETLAVMVCKRTALYEAGDHTIVVGEVELVLDLHDGETILYQNRAYRRIGEVVEPELTPEPKKA